ncbi:MAG: rhomboid family intramembrane serine protease [Chloroflexota bacterium]|nr:rhomboid family intramembrane serine protease [Chloroflexota bacterium]
MIDGVKRAASFQAAILFVCVFLAWSVELVDRVALRGSLERYGIHPRDLAGLWGIVLAPLLHVSWVHLAANTVPFVVLGWLVMLRRLSDLVVVSAVAILVGGLGVWMLGAPNSVHIGASGLVFGYLGYLLARAYFERSLWALVLGAAAMLLYGGVLWGVLPGQPGISWEGHLFGFVGGVAAARLLVATKPPALRPATLKMH